MISLQQRKERLSPASLEIAELQGKSSFVLFSGSRKQDKLKLLRRASYRAKASDATILSDCASSQRAL